MKTRLERQEAALIHLRSAAARAIKTYPSDTRYRGPLEVVTRLTPSAVDMAMAAHAELADDLAYDVGLCGFAPSEIVEVLNKLKELVEQIDGRWFYESNHWQDWGQHRAQVLASGLLEVAK